MAPARLDWFERNDRDISAEFLLMEAAIFGEKSDEFPVIGNRGVSSANSLPPQPSFGSRINDNHSKILAGARRELAMESTSIKGRKAVLKPRHRRKWQVEDNKSIHSEPLSLIHI